MWFYSFDKSDFTAEHSKVLQDTTLTEEAPGTILRDFDALLNFVSKKKLMLTPSYQLSLKELSPINQLLTNPIDLDLKRPQQKSYPHINGLYLLLRASGLTFVDTMGKKPVLVLDETLVQEWQALNSTERYCSLLETWFLRGAIEIIGERGTWGLPDHFRNWAFFYHRNDNGNVIVKGNSEVEQSIRFFPGLVNIGLLDLFGFISIKRGTVEKGQGWQIDSIQHTPLGEAMLMLLSNKFVENFDFIFSLDYANIIPYGTLQPMIQPYFPEWKNNLSNPEWNFRKGTYTFKVSLGNIWSCRIEIGAKQVLDDLAYAILRAVKFDSDHLYRFSYQGRSGKYQHIQHPYMDEPPFTSEVAIGDVSLNIGQSMTYLFDFGDNWEFEVTLEKIDESGRQKKITLLESHGEPPEQYPNWDE